MKVFVDEDERYPDYKVRQDSFDFAYEVEISETEFWQGREIEKAYEQWQKKLAALYQAALAKE